MVIETLHSDYSKPKDPEGTVFRQLADLEAKDQEWANAGLELPAEDRRRFGELCVVAATLQPHFITGLHPSPDEDHPYLVGEAGRNYALPVDYPHTTDSSDSILAA